MTKGPTLLAAFLKRYKLRPAELARALGCAPAHVSNLLSGKRSAGLALAFMIERYTRGGVPATSWLTAEERSSLRSVEPVLAAA
jgi:plasmid maintenance system antidote protein VapI